MYSGEIFNKFQKSIQKATTYNWVTFKPRSAILRLLSLKSSEVGTLKSYLSSVQLEVLVYNFKFKLVEPLLEKEQLEIPAALV